MPFYYNINERKPAGRRTAANLLKLRKALDQQIPSRTVEGTLLLATWNIRDFDNGKYDYRTDEAMYYIAEIISRFDLIAVQEVNDDLKALTRLMTILGGWWKAVMTDTTAGSGGNSERMVFLYDSRKIRFGGLAGEVVIPPKGKLNPSEQLSRTPFIAGFKSGWFRFMLCTVHIYYGTSKADDPKRVKEIRELAAFLSKRVKGKNSWAENLMLLGDFNIFRPGDVTFNSLLDNGFKIPAQLQKLPSNALKNKHYDQIAFITPRLEEQIESMNAGVFDFFKYVFRDQDEATYLPEMGKAYYRTSKDIPRKNKSTHYKMWRTHQMSDHLPMWIELKTDFGTEYLQEKSGMTSA